MARYHHRYTSIKALLLILPIGALVAASFLFVAREPKPAIAAVLAVFAFVAIVIAVFSTLTVEVTDDALVFGFTFGALRRRIPRTEIARAGRITLPWWYGTGVKLGPGRTTYLIWPGPAVEVDLKNGRRVQIGTPDADAVIAALAR